jgi:hypothetical protein
MNDQQKRDLVRQYAQLRAKANADDPKSLQALSALLYVSFLFIFLFVLFSFSFVCMYVCSTEDCKIATPGKLWGHWPYEGRSG